MYRFIVFQVLIGILGAVIASKKGRNPLVWGLLCFIFPLLIFVIGMAPSVRSGGQTRPCPSCGKAIRASSTECGYCGKEMPINLVRCRECGSFVPEKEYCMKCNRKLRA